MVLAGLLYDFYEFFGSRHFHSISLYLQVDLLILVCPIEVFIDVVNECFARIGISEDVGFVLFILVLYLSVGFGGKEGLDFGQQSDLRYAFVGLDMQLFMTFDAVTT